MLGAPDTSVHEIVCRSVEDLRRASLSFDELFEGLQRLGSVVILGGAARDWLLGKSPADLDLVVDVPSDELKAYMKPFRIRRNPFGGYTLNIVDCKLPYLPSKVDLWALQDTWAIKSFPDRFPEPSLKDLRRTVFFNLDAILVEPRREGFLDIEGFNDTLLRKTLDIVLESNPFPYFCVVKALVQASKYQLKLSERLIEFCLSQAQKGLLWQNIVKMQFQNWGSDLVTREQADMLLGSDFLFFDETPSVYRKE